ncbi:MAG: 2Fe-2S iron-sulfur cluster-binding protein [Arenicellales bacterium]
MNSRLSGHGLLIDRSQPVHFSFEGRSFQGFEGDSIASALAANGQWLLSRSFKYHRPRGILTMAGQDANTLVQLPGEPNVLADREPLREGLKVKAQNCSGGLEHDRLALLGAFSAFLPVGFYYKTFFRPRGAWNRFWAPRIRRLAGLGEVDVNARSGYFDKQYRFCDVCVVGGGPAGLEAALFAARAGASVLLVEENRVLGGALTYARFDAKGESAGPIGRELVAAVQSEDGIEVMTDAVVNGWFSDNWLAIIKGNRLHKTRARQTVICAGALEQPALFRNNDLPGVVMSSAVQRLIKLYAVRPGGRAVVLAGNDDGYGAALDLHEAGVEVAAIVDMRAGHPGSEMTVAARDAGIRVIENGAIYEAHGRANHLQRVDVHTVAGRGRVGARIETIECDLLCMATGYTPAYQLPCQGGARLVYDDATAMFSISGLPPGMHLAGSVDGVTPLEQVRAHGRYAAARALEELAIPFEAPEAPERRAGESVNHPWPIFPHPRGKVFVDYDEDLQLADIVNAVIDGYEHVQLVKRYSTVGMGPSQGRHSALATARLVAEATARSVAEVGVTTARPPFAPEKIAHNAGRSSYPVRRSNMHACHVDAGAEFLQAGDWLRPAWYGDKNDRDRCVASEAANVRDNVGLVDVSTLGGLDIRGPDAAELIERMYTWGHRKQKVGRARYALMCNEAGVVIDDGVACRLHEQYFYVTATTGGVDRVYRNMLHWNARWRLDVDIANVTSAWAGVNIAGPASREVLQAVCDDVDLSARKFPYMGVRQGSVAGIPARILRVGFVGELGFEVHVPAHYGRALWRAVLQSGASKEIRPFGIEAQRLLRLEKGHVIIGQDTDAMSTPEEIQMAWAVGRGKPFFVGGRTLEALAGRPPKRRLVGFTIDDKSAPRPQEGHLVLAREEMTGRVTSCSFSPTLDSTIGLAYVTPEQSDTGAGIVIRCDGGARVRARVADLPFYDPDNRRQEM